MPAMQVVPLKSGSDGDYTHRPSESSAYILIDPPTLYLERIGLQWMQDRGEAKPGVKYALANLPAGYALYERPRKNGLKDKYLFGHPDHKSFDSPNRFFPHFKYLMENNGDRIGCPCTVCDPRGGVLPGKEAKDVSTSSKYFPKHAKSNGTSRESSNASSRKAPVHAVPPAPPKGKGLTGTDSSRVDEEGTPDVYRNLIDRLKSHGTVDEAITEPLSLDWRAEQEIMPSFLAQLQKESQSSPRVGDIVLFKNFKNTPSGKPEWEAGVVGQRATSAEVDEWDISYTGVRVEPLPNPNDTDKSISKRHKFIPPNGIRPFFLWDHYLHRIPEDQWHPTIHHALTVSATMSLVGKYRFQGTWPEAHVFCHAVYIGHELISVGDTIRILPKEQDQDQQASVNILVIKTIRLLLSNLHQASTNDYDDGRPYNSEVWLYGSAYTTDISRSSKEWVTSENIEAPRAASGYGDWYPLHPADKELSIPFTRVIGRLYEEDVISSWLHGRKATLHIGQEGITEARKFAAKEDQRIARSFGGASWFWADSRAKALDIRIINGFDVSEFDTQRDPTEWRKKLKAMLAHSGTDARQTDMHGSEKHESDNSLLPLRTAQLPKSVIGNKRNVIDVSDDEDSVRRYTEIVEDVPLSAKKTRVTVVID